MQSEQKPPHESAPQSSKNHEDLLSEKEKDLVCREALRLMQQMPEKPVPVTPDEIKLSQMD